MPRRPPRPCAHPGCRALVHGAEGRCDRHRRQVARERDDRRGSSTARGYGSDWQRLRVRKLQADPLCEGCKSQGRVSLAEEVDHIVRIVERPDLRLDMDNLQSLCRPCHAAKSAAERSGRLVKGCDVDGVPLDPGHHWNRGSD